MAEFKLAAPIVAQKEFKADGIKVLRIVDTPGVSVMALVELGGNASFHEWIEVCNADNYDNNWSDAKVESSTRAHFTALDKKAIGVL